MTKRGMLNSVLGLFAAILMTASLSFASLWGNHRSSAKSADFTLGSPMALTNGKVLDAGTYRIEVPQNSQAPEVTFYKDGNRVAEAQAKVVTENQKNPYTEVVSTQQGKGQLINAILPGGWTEKLVFNETNEQTSKAGK